MKISQKIIKNLKSGGADFFLSVPCKLLANMITILENDKEIYYSVIPREEEGMGICAGAYLGNKLPCIMMQNTGIGNSVNSIVSLLQLYQMPVVFLISYRGTPGNLWELRVAWEVSQKIFLTHFEYQCFIVILKKI